MNIKKSFSFAFAFVLSSLLFVSVDANAQGRYANVYSKGQVSDIIKRAENSSNKFRTDFREQMNRNNNLSNSQKNQFNRNVADCEDALDRLRRRFDSDNTWWNTRGQVQDVINSSQRVNTMMNVLPFKRNLERQWNQLRNDINTLADTYDLPGLNGGGWTGGPGNPGNPGWGGGNPVAPPSWARGTFYGRSPQNGSQITLTIANNGSVTANVGGSMSYGSFTRGNYLNINGNVSQVTRLGNGIRTTSTGNRETIDYSRNWVGPDPGWGGGGGGSNVPNWAVGSFSGRNPQTGGTIMLSITVDGRVTVNMDGNYSYGTLNGTLLNINGNTSTLSKLPNGIRTTSTSDRQRIDYRKY